MKCPFCGSENTKVIDSRAYSDGNSIKRRRECEDCKKRFTTHENDTISAIVPIATKSKRKSGKISNKA